MENQQLITYTSHQKVVATVANSYNNLIKILFKELEQYVRDNSMEVNKINSISTAKLLLHMRGQNVDLQNKLSLDLNDYLTSPPPFNKKDN